MMSRVYSMRRAVSFLSGKFGRSREGASAVEFAILAPVFALIFGVTMDLGGVLFVNFTLNNALSSATNYTLLNAANVNSTSGATLASSAASIIANSRSTGWANSVVVVNNGPTATATSGTVAASGTASNADSCYCPTVSGSTVTWGAAVACSSACAGGGLAGKFVTFTATRAYQPIFSSYGIVKQGTLTATAIAQTL